MERFPFSGDYVAALQNPGNALLDPALAGITFARSPLGGPKVVTGNFAAVFRGTVPASGRTVALRCFTRPVTDVQERYSAIASHLTRRASAPYLVPLEYQINGVRVAGQTYPVIVMDWVEGRPLDRYIETIRSNRAALLAFGQQWQTVVRDLEDRGIAHGDLQHGNVLVTNDGRIRLIDYDGMYVPALAGRAATEAGHPNYQSPHRTKILAPTMDRFGAWTIALAIRALSADPALWDETDMPDDALLFRRVDLERPAHSHLVNRIKENTDPWVRHAIGLLIQHAESHVPMPPLLDEVVRAAPGTTRKPSAQASPHDGAGPSAARVIRWDPTAQAHRIHPPVSAPRPTPDPLKSTDQPRVAASRRPNGTDRWRIIRITGWLSPRARRHAKPPVRRPVAWHMIALEAWQRRRNVVRGPSPAGDRTRMAQATQSGAAVSETIQASATATSEAPAAQPAVPAPAPEPVTKPPRRRWWALFRADPGPASPVAPPPVTPPSASTATVELTTRPRIVWGVTTGPDAIVLSTTLAPEPAAPPDLRRRANPHRVIRSSRVIVVPTASSASDDRTAAELKRDQARLVAVIANRATGTNPVAAVGNQIASATGPAAISPPPTQPGTAAPFWQSSVPASPKPQFRTTAPGPAVPPASPPAPAPVPSAPPTPAVHARTALPSPVTPKPRPVATSPVATSVATTQAGFLAGTGTTSSAHPAAVVAPRPRVYVASPRSKGRLFHRVDCDYTKRLSQNDRLTFTSYEDAIRQGFYPCDRCYPT